MSLFSAITSRDLSALAAELARGADANMLAEGKRTPLIEAAATGWLEGVKALLDGGAEPSWKDDAGETALLKAAANGHRDVARLLAPFGSEDERDMARAFLGAVGAAHDPEFHYDESRLKVGAAEFAARAADFLGYEEPSRRVERARRATAAKKK